MTVYRFKRGKPNEKVPILSLSVKTIGNLKKLSARYGIKFEPYAYRWDILQHSSKWSHGRRIKPKVMKEGKDTLVEGRGPMGAYVEYWRHETRAPGAGQTSLYVSGKKYRVTGLLGSKKRKGVF